MTRPLLTTAALSVACVTVAWVTATAAGPLDRLNADQQAALARRQGAATTTATRPAGITLYNWSQGKIPFGRPVVNVTAWSFQRDKGRFVPVLKPQAGQIISSAAGVADAPIAIDEVDWTFDQWAAALDELRRAHAANGYPPDSLRVAIYNVPGPPFDNVIAAGPGNPVYDGWIKSLDDFARHPLAGKVWSVSPSLYPVDKTETLERWNKNLDRVLPKYRELAARINRPLIPVLSPHTALWAPEQIAVFGGDFTRAMLDRMKREGLDCIIWLDPSARGLEPAVAAIRDFERAQR